MSNYSLLIVDDESFVVDWMHGLLESGLDEDITIYKAYTPARALEIINTTRIDLLISDINMPDIDGLAVVQEALRVWPLAKAILLTGHPLFEYAKNAISLGVTGYILKTSGDEEILSEVKHALKAVDEEITHHNKLISLQQALDENVTQLKRQVFFTWIRGNYLSDEELAQCRNLLGFSETDEFYYLIVASANNVQASKSRLWESLAIYRLMAIVNHYLNSYVSHIAAEIQESHIVWILQPHADFRKKPSYENILVGALETAQKAVDSSIGSQISFAISEVMQNAVELPEQYSILRHEIERMPAEESIIRLGSQMDRLKQNHSNLNVHLQGLTSALRINLNQDNREAAHETLDQIFADLLPGLNWHSTQTLELYYTLLGVILVYINQNELGDLPLVKAAVHSLSRPWEFSSSDKIQEEMKRLMVTLLEEHSQKKSLTSETITEHIQTYIQENIGSDIFLMDLAETFGYSSNYISRVFSRSAGVTVSEYIAQKKMERIRELMQVPGNSIADIASATGFNSRTYFNTFIKRNTGLSPSELRSSLNSHEENPR